MSKNITNLQFKREEYEKIQELLFSADSKVVELECIIQNKKIDINIFRNIMARLKGMEDIFWNEQKFDMLDIEFIDDDDKYSKTRSPVSYIRRTIRGLDNIINYCSNNSFENTNYIDVYKNKKVNSYQLYNYDLKFNSKYEIEIYDIDSITNLDISQDKKDNIISSISSFKDLLKNPTQLNNIYKRYRKKERQSFYTSCQNFRIDLTIVKSSKDSHNQLIGSGIFEASETYEIEVEFINENIINEYEQEEQGSFSDFLKDNYKDITNKFLTYIGYLLQIINNSNYIIPKDEMNIIRTNYLNYVKDNIYKDKFGTKKSFISPNPVSLTEDNIKPKNNINILKDYSVTDKADGESRLLFIPHFDTEDLKRYNGRVYLINNIIDIAYTGIQLEDIGLTILNGEYIQKSFDGEITYNMLCYDAYIVDNEDITELELFSHINQNTRLNKLINFVDTHLKNHESSIVNILYKKFYFSDNILLDNEQLWNMALEKGKLNNVNIPIVNNYKLDGLIFTPNSPVKDYLGIRWDRNLKWKPAEENTIDFLVDIVDNFNYKYKIIHLYCGKNEYIDGKRSYTKTKFRGSGQDQDNLAYISYLEKDRYNNILSKDGLPIYNDTIVEFRYNIKSTKENNYKWEPLRTRYDKTREYKEKTKRIYGNDIITAKNIWKSIHNPLTIDMISNKKQDKYYAGSSSNSSNITTMRNYHNFIKRKMLNRVTQNNTSGLNILDIGCGRGGDIHKYYDNKKITSLIGIDKSNHCISIAKNRYNEKNSSKLKAKFFSGDCSYRLTDKNAYTNEEAYEEYSKFINKNNFDIISLQFCLHYFFKSEESLDNLIENIDNNIKDKGYVIGSCMNKEKVLQCFDGKLSKEGRQGSNILWKIKRNDFNTTTYGSKINVFVESIGIPQDEYLVNFNEFISKLKDKNIYLINNGLIKFDDKLLSSFKINNGGWDIYMSDAEKNFSELNQYFIFQKNGTDSNSGGSVNSYDQENNEIDKLLTKDEQKLLVYHVSDSQELSKFINSKKDIGFNLMIKGKSVLTPLKDITYIECGKTCGLKKNALNLYSEKLGINLHNKLNNGKLKKKRKEELNICIHNKLKLYNLI